MYKQKNSILQEDMRIINIYAPENWSSKYMEQKLIELKGERESSTIIAGDCNISLLIMGRANRQKMSK